MGRLRALLAGFILLLAFSSLAIADMVVGGLIHNYSKGKVTVAAQGMSVSETATTFAFSEQLYSMNYSFAINGNQLLDSGGNVVGTFSREGFEFTHHYQGSPGASSCDDHYKIRKFFGSAFYYNNYVCTDGTNIVDTGTLYPYSYPFK